MRLGQGNATWPVAKLFKRDAHGFRIQGHAFDSGIESGRILPLFQNFGRCGNAGLLLFKVFDQHVGQADAVLFGQLNRHFFVEHAFKGFHGAGFRQLALHNGFAHGFHHHLQEQRLKLLRCLSDGALGISACLTLQLT